MKKIIQTPNAPAAIGPYSQGIVSNDFIYLSGQIPIVPETGNIESADITGQTKQCIENIKALLKASGVDLEHVIKTTVFLTDMDHFSEMNAVYATAFTAPFPARTTVAVKALPKGSLVEIEVIARVY